MAVKSTVKVGVGEGEGFRVGVGVGIRVGVGVGVGTQVQSVSRLQLFLLQQRVPERQLAAVTQIKPQAVQLASIVQLTSQLHTGVGLGEGLRVGVGDGDRVGVGDGLRVGEGPAQEIDK